MSVEEQILLNEIKTQLEILNSLVPSGYDYVGLTTTGGNLTKVEFKTGGSAGTIISTLTLSYDVDNNLASVTKT
uniref:Uncharacterized protein n=1 Tax=viral metagenome TaxID=1070528 RepID=A0A6M3JWZ6_9ZZZZ